MNANTPKKRRSSTTRKKRQSRLHALLYKRTIAVLALSIIVVALAAGFLLFTSGESIKPSVVVVIIPKDAGDDLHVGFEPSEITVVIGINNTVVWKNEDSDWHTAHSNIPEFNSGLIQPGDNFTHTFLRAGVYPYHCDPHPWMTGVVTVLSATSTNQLAYWACSLGLVIADSARFSLRPGNMILERFTY